MPLEGFDDIELPNRGNGNGDQGRPKKYIDLAMVARGASIACTKEELAALCGVAPSTFYKHLAEDPAIQEAIDSGASMGRATLRRAQWKGAVTDGNPTMLIWLGKQFLGQRDTQTLETNGDNPIVLHLLAAQMISQEILSQTRETTLNGTAIETIPENILDAPTPLE
jgi:hypothetical protein